MVESRPQAIWQGPRPQGTLEKPRETGTSGSWLSGCLPVPSVLSPLSCPGSGALTHASLYLVGAPPWQMELAQEERTPWPPGQGTGSVESDEAACAGRGWEEQAAPNPGGGRSGKCQTLAS